MKVRVSPSIGAATAIAAARGRAPPLSRANRAQAASSPACSRVRYLRISPIRGRSPGTQLGEREAGMGAADVGRDDLHRDVLLVANGRDAGKGVRPRLLASEREPERWRACAGNKGGGA